MKILDMFSVISGFMIVGCLLCMAANAAVDTVMYEYRHVTHPAQSPLSADEIHQAIIRHRCNMAEYEATQKVDMALIRGRK